jgi:NO-binding membrane sensor protein with MHYT domain
LFKIWLAADRGAPRSWREIGVTGLTLGLIIWAQPFFSLTAPPQGMHLGGAGVAASLAIAVVSSIWTFAAFARCQGVLCVVAAAAVLGLGTAASHGVMILDLHGAADLSFDDVPFSAGLGLSSGLAAAGFAALRRWRGAGGALAAAACVVAALIVSQFTARIAISRPLVLPVSLEGLTVWHITPLVCAAVVLAALFAARPVSPATRARA